MSLWVLVCLLPLFAGCEGRGFSTTTPDYDYNSTIFISFYSNTSTDELEEFLNSSYSFEIPEDEDEVVTMETPSPTTPRGRVSGAASLPVCADIRTLLWSLVVMILNAPRTHPL